jgi:hypothetical protein
MLLHRLFLIDRRITEAGLLQSLNLRLKEPSDIRGESGAGKVR